jgi:excisionase family DNA binding protein
VSVDRLNKSLLDAEEVAKMLGVKPGWVYARARAGDIPHIVLGRYRKFRLEAIEAWLEEMEVGAKRPPSRQVTGTCSWSRPGPLNARSTSAASWVAGW